MTEKSAPTLSRTEAQILNLMTRKNREFYGLELIAESKGALKRGTIYVTLGRMEEKGFVESRRESVDDAASAIPRRLYKPTGLGVRALYSLAALGAPARSRLKAVPA